MALSNADRIQLQTSKYANGKLLELYLKYLLEYPSFSVGAFAILAFDYCVTFESETRWVWGRKWDVVRIIFTFSRYLPFIGTGMTVYAATYTSGRYLAGLEDNIIHIIGIVAAEGLLILRIYAFWGCNKKLLIGLLAYAVATLAAAATVELVPFNLIPGTTPSGDTGGFEASRNSAIVYSLLMAYEFVLLSLIVYKKWTSYREISDSMMNKVYQDGVFYIACIAFVTMMNLIFSAALPITYSDLLDLLQIVLHSVLASRILFGLRESNKRVHDASLPLTMSSFHCTSRSGVMVDSAT